jgi:hypothetical protein
MGAHGIKDFTEEEQELLKLLAQRRPIEFGVRTFEIIYEYGKPVRSAVIEKRTELCKNAS